MTLYDADVVSTVGSAPAVYHHSDQIVKPIGVNGVIRSIEEPQFERKDDAVRDLDVPVVLFHVLEAFQVQSEDHGQLLDPHPLLRLLVTAAVITLEFIITTQGLCITETPQTVGNTRVLFYVDLEVEEVLVFAADRLAVQTARLARQDTLEYLVDPRRLGRGVDRAVFAYCLRFDVCRRVLLSFSW